MSQNPTFIQALANATGRAIEVSPHTEATTIGAAYLAGLAVGVWGSFDDIAAAWQPQVVVEPSGQLDRAAMGTARSSGLADGYPTCRRSTSRIAPLTPGKEG